MVEHRLILTALDINFESFTLTHLLVYVNMSRNALPAQVLW